MKVQHQQLYLILCPFSLLLYFTKKARKEYERVTENHSSQLTRTPKPTEDSFTDSVSTRNAENSPNSE